MNVGIKTAAIQLASTKTDLTSSLPTIFMYSSYFHFLYKTVEHVDVDKCLTHMQLQKWNSEKPNGAFILYTRLVCYIIDKSLCL